MSARTLRLGVALCAALAFVTGEARAEGEPPREIAFDWVIDPLLVSVGTGFYAFTTIQQTNVSPPTCEWCAAPPGDQAARNALAWEPPAFPAANAWSWVTLGVGAGGVALGAAVVDASFAPKRGRAAAAHFFEDFFTILEPAVVIMDLNQVVKLAVARQRPYAHYKDDKLGTSEDDLSFFSEHTAAAFALATASGTVFTMRGYRWAPIVWGGGMIFATLTARLRMAADRHYLSDVLVGSAVGSAAGFLMPYFLHRPGAKPSPVALAVSASHEGATITASGRW